MGTRRSTMEIEKGQESVSFPGRHRVEYGNGGMELTIILSIGPGSSLSEVEITLPHNLDIPLILVARKTIEAYN